MKITFQDDVLGEDEVKHAIQLEELGGAAVLQEEALFGEDYTAKFPRGNVSGQVVFVAAKSHDDYGAALEYWADEYRRMNEEGTLVIEQAVSASESVKLTFTGAVCRSVVRASQAGLHWGLRYVFAVGEVAVARE